MMASNKHKASCMAIWLLAMASASGVADANFGLCQLNIARASASARVQHDLPFDSSDLPLSCDDSPNPILVTMPNGSTKSFRKTRAAAAGSYHGESSEDGSSLQYIRDGRGALFGSMVDLPEGIVYQFHLDAAGEAVVTVTPTEDFPEEGAPISDERRLEADVDVRSMTTSSHLLRGTSSGNQDRSLQILSTIDVLVVWTPAAECRNSGLAVGCTLTATTTANMEAMIDLAITETNTAYDLSGINAELRLVHAYLEPSYVEASSDPFGTALSELRSQTDGVMDDVHDLRAAYGADVVAMIIDNTQYCGIGYLGPRIDLMFSVTYWSCATGYYTFGHETGHNLGAHHDRGTLNQCGSTSYNYGWRDTQGQYRDIMAYNCRTDQCDQNPSTYCPKVQRFSNTLGLSNGDAIGDEGNDNARQINNVVAAVAAYYPPSIPGCSSSADCIPVGVPSDVPREVPSEVPSEVPREVPS